MIIHFITGVDEKVRRLTGLPFSILFWSAAVGAWGILIAWLYRDFMNPDGVSYLDLADSAVAHGPLALVNAHWSPLYPALISAWGMLIQPSPFNEFTSVHALNAVIYLASGISLAFFLRELILFRASPQRGDLFRHGSFIAFGFAVFFHYTNSDKTAYFITPDILLAAITFTAAGFFFRILRGAGGQGTYIILGALLALGYYAKSVMLPSGIVLLAILLVWRGRSGLHIRRTLIAAIVMALICAPEIFALSKRVGYLSIGETGRLSHLWWVQGVRPFAGWTGTLSDRNGRYPVGLSPEQGKDKPLHGPRLIMTDPEVLEFAQPIGGTYPLWYDPPYWYAGARVHFDLRRHLSSLTRNLSSYTRDVIGLCVLFGGLVVFAVLATRSRHLPNVGECLFVFWPIAMLIMYALLYTEERYVAPWLIVFWITAYSALFAYNGRLQRLSLVAIAAITLVPSLFPYVRRAHGAFLQPRNPVEHALVARDLNDKGIHPGDKIATVGESFEHYYARIARLHVVAQVTNKDAFWSLDRRAAANVETTIGRTGAKVLVARNRPSEFQPADWLSVPETEYSILLLDGVK